MLRIFIILLSTGFYAGYSPIAQGTAGSVIGVGIYFILSSFSPAHYLIITILLSFVGVWVCTEAEKIFHQKDSSRIVIDEIAGILITLNMIPNRTEYIIAGFLLFRFFDIWKPHARVENFPGGWGVMLDDVIAGIISNVIMHIGIGIFR